MFGEVLGHQLHCCGSAIAPPTLMRRHHGKKCVPDQIGRRSRDDNMDLFGRRHVFPHDAHASASAAALRCHSSAAGAQALPQTLVSIMLSHITPLMVGAAGAMMTGEGPWPGMP